MRFFIFSPIYNGGFETSNNEVCIHKSVSQEVRLQTALNAQFPTVFSLLVGANGSSAKTSLYGNKARLTSTLLTAHGPLKQTEINNNLFEL